ncbi:hypothetical protein AB0O34_35720 [Sphaerisporangium sp. NPDC088356]|uniref:hypothetical protein n=1 Tax=Sphaerisporangium sp. NPDC088356 TaxID=3154871 RepID=UPI0034146CED
MAQQHLLNALEAALHIARDDATQKVSSYLARSGGASKIVRLRRCSRPSAATAC